MTYFMIKDGFESPYYAGLNLVLAVGAVLHWTVIESVIGVLSVLAIYIFAGWFHAWAIFAEPCRWRCAVQ